jgi:hypothetical protein
MIEKNSSIYEILMANILVLMKPIHHLFLRDKLIDIVEDLSEPLIKGVE